MSIGTHFLTIDGARVAVHESQGRGSPIVLVHGHWSAQFVFQPLLDGPLGRQHRVIAIDLPGEGASDPAIDPVAAYSAPAFAQTLVSAARALQLEDAVYVGWSLGGHLVIEAMPKLADASGFCIFGTPPLAYPPNLSDVFLPHPVVDFLFAPSIDDATCDMWTETLVPRSSPYWSLAREHIRASDAGRRAQLGASIGTVGYRDEPGILSMLQQPLAVIHGEEDCLVNLPYIQALQMRSLWRGAVQVVPAASHAIQLTAPDALTELLMSFRRAV